MRQRQFAAIVGAVGQLGHPNIPSFTGIEEHQGQTVHSQEWTEDIARAGKRVVVIGTGASAFQIVPAIADDVSELVIFQRSAPWMLLMSPKKRYSDLFLGPIAVTVRCLGIAICEHVVPELWGQGVGGMALRNCRVFRCHGKITESHQGFYELSEILKLAGVAPVSHAEKLVDAPELVG